MKKKMYLIKTILIGCIVLFMAYMLMNVQPNSNADIVEIENKITSEGNLGTMTKKDSMMIKKVFGLNDAEFEGAIYYKGEGAMDVTELLIIKLKTATE